MSLTVLIRPLGRRKTMDARMRSGSKIYPFTFLFHFSWARSFYCFSKQIDFKYLQRCRPCLFLKLHQLREAVRWSPPLPPEHYSVKVYSGAWKVNNVVHSEWQGSLSPLISVMKCFSSSPLSGYRPLHFPKQSRQRQRTCATTSRQPGSARRWLFSFLRAPHLGLLVWFADKSQVGGTCGACVFHLPTN